MLQCLCTISLNKIKFPKKVTGSLWNYHKDEPKDGAVDNGNEKILLLQIRSQLITKQKLSEN